MAALAVLRDAGVGAGVGTGVGVGAGEAAATFGVVAVLGRSWRADETAEEEGVVVKKRWAGQAGVLGAGVMRVKVLRRSSSSPRARGGIAAVCAVTGRDSDAVVRRVVGRQLGVK